MKDRRIQAKQVLSGRALLAQWIRRHRMTQTEAAEQIGISYVKLNQYLNDKARPSLETAIRIEDATGIGMRLWLIDDPMLTTGVQIAQGNRQEEDSEVNNNHTNRTQTVVKQ